MVGTHIGMIAEGARRVTGVNCSPQAHSQTVIYSVATDHTSIDLIVISGLSLDYLKSVKNNHFVRNLEELLSQDQFFCICSYFLVMLL